MVEDQVVSRGVKDPLVLDAMRTVPRHLFVPETYRKYAYEDKPLPIGEGQTISQPYIVALMTELAKVSVKDRVLEIGTGSGYQAAILAEIAAEVYTIEIVRRLAETAKEILERMCYSNVFIKVGDAYKGWQEKSPFDAIIVTAAPEHIPQPLVDQLKSGSKMVIPVGESYQDLILLTKSDRGIIKKNIIPVRL